jgi:cell division inhibitor SepF
MSLIDKFLNVMRLNDDDEDYAFDNEDYLDDDYEAEKEKRKPVKAKTKEKREVREEESPRERTVKTSPKITPISKGSRKQGIAGMEVCVIKPTSVEDAREITETLLNGRTVVLNVEGLDIDTAQRIIDFTSGSCFAISGNFQKISNYIFIITPANVEISGDFLNLVDSLDTGNTYNY